MFWLPWSDEKLGINQIVSPFYAMSHFCLMAFKICFFALAFSAYMSIASFWVFSLNISQLSIFVFHQIQKTFWPLFAQTVFTSHCLFLLLLHVPRCCIITYYLPVSEAMVIFIPFSLCLLLCIISIDPPICYFYFMHYKFQLYNYSFYSLKSNFCLPTGIFHTVSIGDIFILLLFQVALEAALNA